MFSTSTLTPRPRPPPQRDLFWLHELCLQNGHLSIYPTQHASQYIYDYVTSLASVVPQASTLLLPRRRLQVMNVPPLQPCPVPPRLPWTECVSREETLGTRETSRKIGWFVRTTNLRPTKSSPRPRGSE